MSVGPNQGQKKRRGRRPTVRRKACTVRTKVLVPPTHKAIPALRQWIIGWWIANPNMGKPDEQGSTPLHALAQEDKSRPFQLTGATALQIVSFQRATTWLPMAQGTGHVSTKKIRAVGANIGDGLTQDGVLWSSQPSLLILWLRSWPGSRDAITNRNCIVLSQAWERPRKTPELELVVAQMRVAASRTQARA